MAFKTYLKFEKKLLIVGFGSIGQAVLPLIFRHLEIKPEQVTILTKKTEGVEIAKEYGVSFQALPLTKDNYVTILTERLNSGDFLLNLSVDVSSLDLIKFCQERDVLYLDTCIEPWPGGYTDKALSAAARSNYVLRESVLALRKKNNSSPTAVITHGANPGLVSHFVKQALINLKEEMHLDTPKPTSQIEWAKLAQQLSIKAIHISERDTQVSACPKRPDEFVNTWSIDGFVSEGLQPAELGWGSHEKHWPKDAKRHESGCQSAIYLNRPGAATRVRTWAPFAGPFHGFLITHGESISIADYLSLKESDVLSYRPTVHYAYHPCDEAVLSIHELAGREWQQQDQQRLLFSDIIAGMDELGVLLMGHAKGAYWYGSQLSIEEARRLAPHNTATSLQVAIGVFAAMVYAMRHPMCGIIEPDEIDYEYILKIALPYLGKVAGYHTEWTPLQGRECLFPEEIDYADPWQFLNIRVD